MTINCNGNLVDVSSPKVMGIVNLTPDSFFNGGKFNTEKAILLHVEKMLTDGATFIDVGAYSSRPNAKHITEDEELTRILPIIEILVKNFPEILLSVDTFRSEVAKKCVSAGACMINDISAGNLDDKMMATVAKLQVPYVMMHMKGTPQNMQENPIYDDVIKDIRYFFSEKLAAAREYGINDVLIDPGFGFGKTIQHNYTLLKHLELFKAFQLPLLVGLSRKSMIYKVLKTDATNALNGTTSLQTISLLKGANILRVHDVKEAVECVKLLSELR